jgi:hypothetical protein
MQEDLINKLVSNGIKLHKIKNVISIDNKELVDLYRIEDRDRLIFLIELCEINSFEIGTYVDILMDWTMSEKSNMDKDNLVSSEHNITMQKILWDIYAVFVNQLSDMHIGIQDDEIYRIQRENHFMKKYIIQDVKIDNLVDKVCFLINTENYIDKLISSLDITNDEDKYCIEMSMDNNNDNFTYNFSGKTYKEILKVLSEINDDKFGENNNGN